MGLSVTAFLRDPERGTLTALQTVPTSFTLGPDSPGVSTAEILIHPTGRWLYVSSRGDDIVAVYAVKSDGTLALIENAPAAVDFPRGMGLDPTGRWLITAGQKDNRLAVLEIDAETGKLTPNGQSAEAPSPVCVMFAP